MNIDFLFNNYLSSSHYNPIVLLQRFAAVIMRIREPKTTALIFASGKMVSLKLQPSNLFLFQLINTVLH